MSDVSDQPVNLRDVADLGPHLQPGMLLRSDAPLSGDRAPGLPSWPPRTVIDLRGEAERREPHPFAEHAQIVSLPLLGGGPRRGPLRWPDRLGEMYLGMLAPPASDRLVQTIEVIATGVPPVLVHCSAGKDRTGVAVALALRLVGLAPEEIVADYIITGAAMPHVIARMAATVRRHTEGTAMATLPAHIAAAPAEAIAELHATLDAHDGGAVGWYLSHGGSADTLAPLRARLLTPARVASEAGADLDW